MSERQAWTTSHWREVARLAEVLLVRGFGAASEGELGRLDERLRWIVATAREADRRGLGADVILHDELIDELSALERLPHPRVLRCVHKCESCKVATLQ